MTFHILDEQHHQLYRLIEVHIQIIRTETPKAH